MRIVMELFCTYPTTGRVSFDGGEVCLILPAETWKELGEPRFVHVDLEMGGRVHDQVGR